ncbi:MAG TPA: DUF58 domain-containing protein [Chloroflexi bacterium]|nr:DUF58 domain-containing protein [Chloroflexota bacterium]
MPVRVWAFLLVICILAGTLGNLPWLVFLATTVGMLLLVTHLWRSRSLDGVTYRRVWTYTRGFPGETLPVRLHIENRKKLPVPWLKIVDEWPAEAPPDDKEALRPSHRQDRSLFTHFVTLPGGRKVERHYHLKLGRRGNYSVGPAVMESGDPFGIHELRRVGEQRDQITIYPEILSLPDLHLPTEDPFGDRQTRRTLFSDPNRTIGVRPYRPEDTMRSIHWNATARTGELQVRVYQPISARALMVCLNVSPAQHYWEGVDPAALEQLVKIAASLAYHGMNAGYSIGLLSNGGFASADRAFRIAPGRSPEHLAVLLQSLAGVSPLTLAPFEKLLIQSMSQIPLGATLLIVTSHVPAALVDTLMRLREYRANITLLSIHPEPPPDIPGVRGIHLPFQRES